MILQLQLEVLDFTHTLKRTIELHEGSTFEDLGNVILALFDYDDDGGASFVFEVAKSNDKMATGYIGADFGDDFSIAEEDMHDDEDEILSDWLRKEGDTLQYKRAGSDRIIQISVQRRM